MSPDPVEPADLEVDAGTVDARHQSRNTPLTRPQPGHADLVDTTMDALDDARPVLERASARETATRVALGAVAAAVLEQVAGVRLVSHVVAVGPIEVPDDAPAPEPYDVAALDEDPIRCFHPATSEAMVAEIDACRRAGDPLGGGVEVLAYGLPPGLGSDVRGDR